MFIESHKILVIKIITIRKPVQYLSAHLEKYSSKTLMAERILKSGDSIETSKR